MLVLIGENNSGKSNILEALNHFFTASKIVFSKEHFCAVSGDCTKIEITVTFTDLHEEEKERFKDHLEENILRVKRRAIRTGPDGGGELGPFLAISRKPIDSLLQTNKSDVDSDHLEKLMRQYTMPTYVQGARGPTVANVREHWNELVHDLAPIKGWSTDFQESRVIGYNAVAQGNLPKFLWLPAVENASEAVTTSQKSLFGHVFHEVLTEISSTAFADEVQIKLGEIRNALNERIPDRPNPIQDLERELETLFHEHIPDTRIHLLFDVPSLEQLMTSGSSVQVDDGVRSGLEHKGHGMQRLIIFTVLRAFARRLNANLVKTPRSFILAIEEPEIYQHPPAQKRLFEVLKIISQSWQTLLATHSPYFLDMSEPKSILYVSRQSRTQPTSVLQVHDEIFTGNEKNEFKLLSKIDPTRGEIFFSTKVILVEGDTEKMAIPLIAEKMDMGLSILGVSIIEAGGKGAMPFFQHLMNAFGISYLVIYDEDPVDPNLVGEKLEEARQINRVNQIIERSMGNCGRSLMISGDFEREFGVSRSQSEKKGKALAAYKKIQAMTPEQVPEAFRRGLTEFIST